MAKSASEIREELRLLRQAKAAAPGDNGAVEPPSTAKGSHANKPISHVEHSQKRERSTPSFRTSEKPGRESGDAPGRGWPASSGLLSEKSGQLNRALPHSVEAEQGVLGSMIIDPAIIPEVEQKIDEQYFYVPAHQTIFNHLLAIFMRDGTLDLLTFTQYLRDMGQLETVGGPAFVTSLFTFVPTASNVTYYLEIVLDKYRRRQLIAGQNEIARCAWNEAEDLGDLLVLAQANIDRASAPNWGDRKSKLTVRTLSELVAMTFDEADNYFGDRILAAGQACTLLGPGGIGKSRLSMQLAVCMITGRDFVDMPTRGRNLKWLFVQSENNNRRLHYDLKNMVTALGLTEAEVYDVDRFLVIHTLEHDLDSFLNLINPANYGAVNGLIQDTKPDFVQWDPLNSFTDNDLNSDMDMRAVVTAISRVTRQGNPNRVPLVLHHSLTGKAGAQRAVSWDKSSYGRNSKVLQAWTRAQINLAPRTADDTDLLIMACGKNNNGKPFPEVGIKFDEKSGIYLKDGSFDPEAFREDVGIESSKHKTVTPEDVKALCEDGIPKPKLVGRIKDTFGIKERAAYDAINRTEAAGLIKKSRGKNWNSTYSLVHTETKLL